MVPALAYRFSTMVIRALYMLRINLISQTSSEVVLGVDGWLSGDEVMLLDRECRHWSEQAERLILVIDGLRSVDEAGLSLLQRWLHKKVRLQGGSLFLRNLLKTYGIL